MDTNDKRTEEAGEQEPRHSGQIPVVGIGASAGGIGALEALLALVKVDSGLAFVVVERPDPDRECVLISVLSRGTGIPVLKATDRMPIEPDHIYIAPRNATLTIVDDRLHLGPISDHRAERAPIDTFFVSLAHAKGENAACVILSDTGSDGTLGVRAIKEQGGLTIAPQGADEGGVMVRSTPSTSMVDFVLPLDGIPSKLEDYFQHLIEIDDRKGADGVRWEAAGHVAQICTLLRLRTGHDFSGYRDETVARRIQRRMQVRQIGEVPDFIERLRKEPRELDALLQDLLFGAMSFFRDPEAFEALEREVIPRLFEGKGPNDSVRVWVPGCSTGEEAYSIAMLLREHSPKGRAAPKLQIFASDTDEGALQVARVGRFPSTIASDVSPARLERYFVREDDTYRIASDLREICLFSAHDLLRDAPFSKLDLISCRNLLIHLTPELQNRLIPLFHFALNNSGYLYAGASENIVRHSQLFAVIDKAHRIFKRRAQADRRIPEFPLTIRQPPLFSRSTIEQEPLQATAERQLLDRYSPAYVIVNADGDLIQGSGRTGRYLELPPGAPRMDIFSMARIGLQAELRAGLHKAVNKGQIVIQKNVVVDIGGGRQTIDLVIQPMRAAQETLYLVVFRDVGGIEMASEAEPADPEQLESDTLRQLEAELRAMRERLQTTSEELEAAREELQTINAELSARVEELSRANSDIANLLESTQIAAVFLDRNLAVKRFTPAAKELFRLVDGDTGRRITHVRACFEPDTVREDAERVLRTLSAIERQVESTDKNARYVMRMLPYRTVDNAIGGVVITFANVARMPAAEAPTGEPAHGLRNRVQSLETLLNLLPVGILMFDDHRIDQARVNRYGAELLGVRDGAFDGAGLRLITTAPRFFEGERELGSDEHPLQRAVQSGKPTTAFEGKLARADGSRVDVMVLATPLFDDAGQTRGAIAVLLDISERKAAEAHQKVLLYELQHRVKNILATIGALATRMLSGGGSLEDFSAAFLGRLRAMATTHDLLSRTNWAGADLRQLVETVMRGQSPAPGAVAVEGPEVVLTPNTASTLGMVLYELFTNAVKYGALAEARGRIEVSWRLDRTGAGDRLALKWQEIGGPPPPGSMVEGFGTGFIRRSVEYELQGTAVMEPAPAGLRWLLEFPLEGNVQRT